MSANKIDRRERDEGKNRRGSERDIEERKA